MLSRADCGGADTIAGVSDVPVFARVVVGVDETDESLAAVSQAARLLDPGGELLLVSAVQVGKAAGAGFGATRAASQLEADAAAGLERAQELVPDARTLLVRGEPLAAVVGAIEQESADLVAVGSHERRRGAGLLLGSVATSLLRDVPCAVLVARPPADPDRFPARLVAGVDGSAEGDAAAGAARRIAERHGAELRLVVARGGKNVDADAVRASHPEADETPDAPVDALLAAADGADLIVLGSRGLHGVKALGSVSERVAHQAPCSVLVIP
jgi:nucleotide-binding universal stress UspA family protein